MLENLVLGNTEATCLEQQGLCVGQLRESGPSAVTLDRRCCNVLRNLLQYCNSFLFRRTAVVNFKTAAL